MEHKWNRLVAGVSLAALLLSGCGEPPAPTAAPTDPTVAVTQPTQPPETEPPVTEPPVTEPPVTEPPVAMEKAVTRLTCTKWRTYPQLQDLGEGRLLAVRNQYSTAHKAVVSTVEILDLLNDAVLAETTLMHTSEPVKQRFSDGSVVLAVPSAGALQIYDSSLNLTGTLEVSDLEGRFSHDRKNYYYAESGMLFRMDVASGNSGAMALGEGLRLERLVGIHPTRNLLVGRVYLSCYGSQCGLAVIDAATGEVQLLTDQLDTLILYGDSFCGMGMDENIYGNDVIFGSLTDGTVTLYDAPELAEYDVGYGLVPGSGYLIRKSFAKNAENVWLYDLETGGMCALEDHGMTAPINGAVYLTGPQLIVGFYEKGLDFYPVVLDPKAMTFDAKLTALEGGWSGLVDQSLLDSLEAELAGPTLPESLAEVRLRADGLEKTYGIHIRLGCQIEATCAHGDFSVAVCEDAAAIGKALDSLEAELSKYPQGFFKQFRDSGLEGGVYFCLSGAIQGGLEPAGFARASGNRYDLVLDVTDANLSANIHHEIWHAIEMRISVEHFALAGWDKCNPAGFTYYGSYDGGYADQTRWTYTAGSGADSYFVDPYSRINGREDRASLWASAMGTGEPLMSAPALRAKLKLMDALMRQSFNSGTWTQTRWSRFL